MLGSIRVDDVLSDGRGELAAGDLRRAGDGDGEPVHLGMDEAPHRSTLAYANGHRPWQMYEDVFYSVLGRCQALAATLWLILWQNRSIGSGHVLITPSVV